MASLNISHVPDELFCVSWPVWSPPHTHTTATCYNKQVYLRVTGHTFSFCSGFLKLLHVQKWQRSGYACPRFVTFHIRMSSHPNKLALICSGSVTPLLLSCFISVKVLEIWLQLQLKCNIAAGAGATEKTGEIVGTCSSDPTLHSDRLCSVSPFW